VRTPTAKPSVPTLANIRAAVLAAWNRRRSAWPSFDADEVAAEVSLALCETPGVGVDTVIERIRGRARGAFRRGVVGRSIVSAPAELDADELDASFFE
jgi:hypothetical protein